MDLSGEEIVVPPLALTIGTLCDSVPGYVRNPYSAYILGRSARAHCMENC